MALIDHTECTVVRSSTSAAARSKRAAAASSNATKFPTNLGPDTNLISRRPHSHLISLSLSRSQIGPSTAEMSISAGHSLVTILPLDKDGLIGQRRQHVGQHVYVVLESS